MVIAAQAEAKQHALLIEKLKFTIAKLRHERFGQSSERGAILDQLELQLADLEENAAETQAADQMAAAAAKVVRGFERGKPARRPLPEHLPRERIVYPSPSTCPCCGGVMHKLGEDVTETLELIPRQWKVIQHVREKFSCRSCEAITQPPAPSHPIARGRAGPGLLAMILFAKYGLHLPLNRQSTTYAREGWAAPSPPPPPPPRPMRMTPPCRCWPRARPALGACRTIPPSASMSSCLGTGSAPARNRQPRNRPITSDVAL